MQRRITSHRGICGDVRAELPATADREQSSMVSILFRRGNAGKPDKMIREERINAFVGSPSTSSETSSQHQFYDGISVISKTARTAESGNPPYSFSSNKHEQDRILNWTNCFA